MKKRLSVALVLLLFAAVAVFAAPISGEVAAIDGKKVQITITGEKQDWVKKGQAVKIKGGTGTITVVDGSNITITTLKASSMKVGDQVSFDKGRAASGC